MSKTINWDVKEMIKEKTPKKRNGELIPDDIRCLIVGPSGCGKTFLLFNFLLQPGWLNNNYFYIYSKSMNQPKYQQLQERFEEAELKFKKPIATFLSSNDSIVPIDECEKYSIVVFDDYILENQDSVRNYFTRGRHKHLDCFYLAQTYSKVPKQLVRDNVNFLCIFRQDDTNLKHVYNEFVGGDMAYDKFKEVCSKCWQDDYGFIVIDMTRKVNNGKYRNKIKHFINV